MKYIFKTNLLLIIIVFLAAFLRIYNLSSVPPGVHSDEADTTYTAYSLLTTGQELHGGFNLLGLHDNNTGGTHPPLYTYSQMPFIGIFGMNADILRMPSAIYGIATVLLTYFVFLSLLRSEKIALLGAFLLSVNPWAIHISRAALGESIALFFVVLGIASFLYGFKYRLLFLLSAVSFGLSLYSYDAPKIFLPPFLILLIYLNKDNILKVKKYFLAFAILFLFFYGMVLNFTFFQGGLEHYSRATIFDSIPETVNIERTRTLAPLWASSIFHTKISTSLKKFETSYSSIFSVNWLFVNGDANAQHSVSNHGEFYLFELPFFFIGIFLCFKKSVRLGFFALGWMLVGALPGGLTTGNYGLRSILVLPVPILFSSTGIVWFWELVGKYKYSIVSKALIILIMSVYISSYLFTYFFDYPVYASESWAKQQNDAIKFAISKSADYKSIYIDGGEPWAVDYGFITKLDPKIYQNSFKKQEKMGNVDIIKLNNFIFGNFGSDLYKNPSEFFPKGSLVITNALNFPNTPSIAVFKDPGNVRAIFKVLEVK